MRIFFCSKESGGGDLAMRLDMEGHEVKYHVHVADEEEKNLDGLLDKEKNWRKGVAWCDFMVLDDTGMDDVVSFALKARKPFFGAGRREAFVSGKKVKGSELQTCLEKDRTFAHELMKELKIGNRIESLQFSNIAEALKHLKEHKVAHVIKPEIQGSGSEKTYVGEKEDGSDAIGWLETLPDRPDGGRIKKFEIEERIHGVEVAAAGWFNGRKFIGSPNINFEHKRIATGEIGFNTGEMGTAMFYDPRSFQDNRFARETVYKMASTLSDFDYRGQIDVNCIVNEKGIWPLEFTPRLGYPSIYIEQALHQTPWGEFLRALAEGEDPRARFSTDWSVGALMVGEGYPFWDEGYKRMSGMPILGLSKENIENFHLYNVEFKKDRFLATGCLPVIATASAPKLKDAQEKLYKTVIPQILFPGRYWRLDIGDRVVSDLKKLKEYGYDMGRDA